MASNNLTMSLNLDPSNYLKRMQEVLGTTSARTKEGVTVALHLGLNKKEISNAKKLIDDLNGKSYTLGGKKYTIKTDDLLNIFENSKRMSDAYSTLGKRAKGLADGLLKLQSMIGDSFDRLDNVEFDEKTKQLNRRYDKLREGKIRRDAAYNEKKAAEKAAERAPLLLQNRLDMRDVILRREQYKKSNDIQSEIAANKELISLLKQRARLSRDTKYLEQARTLRRRNEDLGVQLSAERERLIVQKESEKAAGNFEKALLRQNSLMRGLGSLASRYLNIFMISGLVQRVAEMTGYFQKQEVALEGILGSAAKANSVIQSIKIQALKSPFTTEQIVGNVKQIAAYGIPAEDLVPTAKMLGDLSSGLGVDMNRLILAYGQVKSAAVLRGQELRQFTEAGVPMVQKLADKFTELNGRLVTTGEVFELISKRQVSFEMVAEVLRDMTSEGGQFYNMQENVMETLYGQIGKLKDMWSLSLNDIGSTFGKTIMGVIKALQFAMQNFSLVLFTIIGKGLFGAMVSPFKTFIQTIGQATKHVNLYKASLLALRRIFRSVNLATFGINAAVNALSLALGILINKIVKAHEFEKSMNKISDTFTKDAAKMIVGLDKLIGKLKSFPDDSKAFKEAMSTILSNYADYINESDIAKIREISDLNERKKAWDELSDSITEAIRAKKRYDMHESMQQEAGDKAASNSIRDIMRMLIIPHESLSENSDPKQMAFNKKLDAIGQVLKKGEVERAILMSLNEMVGYGYSTVEQLVPILKENLTQYGIEERVINEVIGKADEIIRILEKTEEWQRYNSETEALEYGKNSKTRQIFNAATKSLEGKENSLIGKDITYIGATKQALSEIVSNAEFENIFTRTRGEQDKYNTDELKRIQEFANSLESITEENWDAESVANVADEIYKISEIIGNKELRENLNFVKKTLVETAGVRTNIAADIATGILKYDYGNDEKFRNFAMHYIPTNETYETIRTNLKDKYDANAKKIAEHSKDSSWEPIIKKLKEENRFIEILGRKDLYDINFNKNNGGSGYSSKGGYRQLFNEFFSIIKESKSEQDKLATVTGLRDTFKFTLESLDEDNILRSFYEGGNPFQPVLDKIKEFGINAEGVFKDTDFSGLTAKYKDGLADYEALWDDLLKIINNKIEKGGLNSATKNALIAFRNQMVVEGNKLFSKIDVNAKIDRIIKSLGKIEANTNKENEKYEVYDKLRNIGGYSAASQAIYGEEKKGFVLDKVELYTKQLNDMLAVEGVGIGDYVQNLNTIIKGARLNIENLSQIFEIINEISEIGSAEGVDPSVLEKTKDSFVKVLKELVNAITDDYEKMNSVRTKSEKNAISIENDFDNFKKEYDSAFELWLQDDDLEKYGVRIIEATKRLFDNIAIKLGGTGNTDIVQEGKQIPINVQNLLGSLSGGMDLKQIYGNIYADKVASSGSADMANMVSEAVSKFSSVIAIIDAIIKTVYQTLKAVTDIAKELIDTMESTNKIKGYSIDKAGNFNAVTRYDSEKNERVKAGFELVQTFNQHVMDGWEKFKKGDFLGAVFETISSITDLISGISKLIDLEKTQAQESNNKLIEQIKKWGELYEYEEGYVAGIDKWNKQMDSVNAKLLQNELLQKNISLELDKKAGDEKKIQEFEDQIIENNRAISDTIKGIKEQILGTADELANTLGNAFVEAFRQGDNAARAWRDAFKSYIGDALSNLLIAKVIAPQLEELIDMYAYGFTDILDENGNIIKDAETQAEEAAEKNNVTLADWIYKNMTNPKFAKEFNKSSNELLTKFTDLTESLPKSIQDYLFYKSDSSSLSGGIQGITEDTARRLEAMGNSQLGEVFSINNKMSSIQSDIAKTASNVALIYALMDNMSKGVNRLHVTMD